jgi:hypothetical protein
VDLARSCRTPVTPSHPTRPDQPAVTSTQVHAAWLSLVRSAPSIERAVKRTADRGDLRMPHWRPRRSLALVNDVGRLADCDHPAANLLPGQAPEPGVN